MKLWIKALAIAAPIAAALLLLALLILLCRRRRRQRHLPPASSFTESASKSRNDTFPSALAKLHLSYKSSNTSKSSHRFHHLHRHHQHHEVFPPFSWDAHPHLVTDAVEHGWSRFTFTSSAAAGGGGSNPRAARLYAVCDGGRPQDTPGDVEWELPPVSPEFMQTVRLGGVTSSAVRMSLPLPGPRLAGNSFPQEAYFEITILVLQLQQHRSSKTAWRARDGDGSDHAKLIDESPSAALVHSPLHGAKEEEGRQREMAVSVGLEVGDNSSSRAMPGTYPGSIGFNSDGSVHLDGMKLVFESERAEWAGVDRVIGCGFNPGKKKVFLTVDSELVHVINCNSDTYTSPLYPVLAASKADVMVLVNLGQTAFKYEPANARRTPNPCFVRTGSNDGGAVEFGFVDSRELFSMGRIDAEDCFDITRPSNLNSYCSSHDGRNTVDFDAESELFEISLQK